MAEALEEIRIDQLGQAGLPLSGAEQIPAMQNGLAVYLTPAQINDLLVAGAGAALDTLAELAAALGDDENFAATVTDALSKRLRFDAAQVLSNAERMQARANIGVAPAVGGNVLAPHENLVVQRLTTNAVRVTADALLVRDSDGNGIRLENVDITININNSGANGLDTGSEQSNTWYHIPIIYNPASDTIAGLFSESATSPVMPSGYTYKGYVGAVYNDGLSAFVPFFQRGADVVSESSDVVSVGVATSFSAIDLSGVVPETASVWKAQIHVRNTSNGDAVVIMAPEGSGTTETHGRVAQFRDQQNNNYWRGASFECLMSTPQQVLYRVLSNNEANIRHLGWRY